MGMRQAGGHQSAAIFSKPGSCLDSASDNRYYGDKGRDEEPGGQGRPQDQGWITPPPAEWEKTADEQGERTRLEPEGYGTATADTPGPGTSTAEKPKAFTLRKLFRDVVIPLVVAFAVAMFVQATVAKPYKIPSGSMLPTINLGDRILANRVVYHFQDIQRGDVVVFQPPTDTIGEPGVPFIKRVVGLPGDTIEVREGKTLVNGNEFVVPDAAVPSYTRYKEVVPEGQLFVLGDNRNQSADSHIWGYVPIENIIGRVEFVYWPPRNLKFI